MKFAYIPKASYTIGQIITVHGKPMRVESYLHTGKNVTVTTLVGAPKFERMVCICTDSAPIEGVTASAASTTLKQTNPKEQRV